MNSKHILMVIQISLLYVVLEWKIILEQLGDKITIMICTAAARYMIRQIWNYAFIVSMFRIRFTLTAISEQLYSR